MKKQFLHPILISVIVLLTLFLAAHQAIAQNTHLQHYNLKSTLAIQGYDPVSYFKKGPQKGAKSIIYMHKGITYRFVNAENRKTFIANPEKYEPQYGGWCAYAMGKDGSKVAINPKTYKIKDGKLYLFYNAWGTNTLSYWNKDEANLQPKADTYWKKIIK